MYHFNRRNYVCLPLDMLRFNVAMFLITKVYWLETPRSKKQLDSLTYGSKQQNRWKILKWIHHSLHFFGKLQQWKAEGLLGRLAVKLETIIYYIYGPWMKSPYSTKHWNYQKILPNLIPPNQPDFIKNIYLHLFHPQNHFNQDFCSLVPSKLTHFSPSFQLRPRCLRRWRHGLCIIRGCDGNFFVHAGGNFGNQQHLEKRNVWNGSTSAILPNNIIILELVST